MKGNDLTNNELEQLFSNLIAQSPLIAEEEVSSMLFNLPDAKPKSSLKHYFSNYLNTLLISATVILLTVGVALVWINSDVKNTGIITRNNQEKHADASVCRETLTMDSAHIADSITGEKTISEVFVIEKPEPKEVATVVAEDSVSLADIMKYHEKKPQVFTIRPDKDTILFCSEGTTIEIKANSFVLEKTGEKIIGNVRIAVREYYKLSDMVLAALSTISGDILLETGGMLHVSAKAGKENCSIRLGRELLIGFPYSKKKKGMVLFNGEKINNVIDWQLANENVSDDVVVIDVMANNNPEPVNEVFFIVENMPEYPGGDKALRTYIAENALIPYSALNDKIEGKVHVTFIVDTTGATKNIRVVRSLNKTLDKVAVYLVSQMPKWKPGKQRGKPVNVSYTVPVAFSSKQGELTEEEIRRAKQLDEKLKELKYDVEASRFYRNSNEFDDLEEKIRKRKFDGIKASEVNRYIFSATQLGWLNCDKFYKSDKSLTNIFILENNPDEVIVSVIFHRFRSIIRGKNESDKIVFKNLPLGEKVTIVALKTEGNKIFLAVNETEITNEPEIIPDYKKVTMKLLKKKMEELDHVGL
ncbi:energy transducer TonB [Prolixibacteraceae bacterium Z1-6]|uniref:Energy transducer TonB n=1 Tax=Draconibacterium aestuarii TaxID=2998507 RepID=A0A9X3J5T9_9BACT|nr:energy transducer TonB [Prolixibacteraceae bacterium Z1-6]